MSAGFRELLLRMLRIPAEPAAPAGAPESVRVFRASKNFFRLNLIRWGLAQSAILLVLVLGAVASGPQFVDLPSGLVIGAGVVIFLAQAAASYLLIRFDYQMRFYVVTDRSLRIRHGIVTVRELTMTFANIQQITVQQGPLQRLLGIADLQVRSAGGGSVAGSADGSGRSGDHSMHFGYFRGIENADAIRDLMLERLRRWRDVGLGDTDDASAPDTTGHQNALLDAARDVLNEVNALRQSFAERSG